MRGPIYDDQTEITWTFFFLFWGIIALCTFLRRSSRRRNNYYRDKIYYLDSERKIPAPLPNTYGYKKIKNRGGSKKSCFYFIPQQNKVSYDSIVGHSDFLIKDYDEEKEICVWDEYGWEYNSKTYKKEYIPIENILKENIKTFLKELDIVEVLDENNDPLEKYTGWDINWKFLIGKEEKKNKDRQRYYKYFTYIFIAAREKKEHSSVVNIFIKWPGGENYDLLKLEPTLYEILDKLTAKRLI